jgi:hypothetical protein
MTREPAFTTRRFTFVPPPWIRQLFADESAHAQPIRAVEFSLRQATVEALIDFLAGTFTDHGDNGNRFSVFKFRIQGSSTHISRISFFLHRSFVALFSTLNQA